MFYSIVVKFIAEEDIYFPFYPGESFHGLLYSIFERVNEAESKRLHNDYKLKPFTISPVLPYLKWKQGKRYMKAGKVYFVRLTLLEDKWYNLFMQYFLHNPGILELNGVKIKITEILTDDTNKHCKIRDPHQLIKDLNIFHKLRFVFHSTTSFRVGDKHIIYPKPGLFYHSILKKWEIFGKGLELILSPEDFESVYLSRYDLKSAMERFSNYDIKGFKGRCEFEIDPKLSREKVKAINLLSSFAYFSGVGYKTTMGLGQVERVK